MPNLQQVLVAAGVMEEVACAIFCCDKKAYPLKKRKGDKECQRLGSKKHSCVLHKFREHDKSGRLTQKSSNPKVLASPRYDGITDRTLIPDLQVGDTVVDAKFPCKPPLEATKGNQKKVQRSDMNIPGTDMTGAKEEIDYGMIPGVEKVFGMTPKDAEEMKSDCKCG